MKGREKIEQEKELQTKCLINTATIRENLNKREGQTDSTPVDFFTWTLRSFDIIKKFNYRGPLQMNIEDRI